MKNLIKVTVLFFNSLLHDSSVSMEKGFTNVKWQTTEHFCHILSEVTVLFLLKLNKLFQAKAEADI